MNTRSWSAEVDAILGGDLTAALAMATTRGGAICTAVAPIGLRDQHDGTVTFLTSLGTAKKLKRIDAEPRVALAYHSRRYGKSSEPGFVLVQGRARADFETSQTSIDHMIDQATSFLGEANLRPKRFWRWWLREYATVRVPVVVTVERIVAWQAGEQNPSLWNRSAEKRSNQVLPVSEQRAPDEGTAARLDVRAARERVLGLPHQLLAFLDDDGAPVIVPVDIKRARKHEIRLESMNGLIPTGQRRAGILAHDYRPQLIGIRTRQMTGWLRSISKVAADFAPFTEAGYAAPANKTILLLANGFLAKRGLRKAVRAGDITRWPVPFEHSRSRRRAKESA